MEASRQGGWGFNYSFWKLTRCSNPDHIGSGPDECLSHGGHWRGDPDDRRGTARCSGHHGFDRRAHDVTCSGDYRRRELQQFKKTISTLELGKVVRLWVYEGLKKKVGHLGLLEEIRVAQTVEELTWLRKKMYVWCFHVGYLITLWHHPGTFGAILIN